MISGPQSAPWTHVKIDTYVVDVLSHLNANPVPFPDANVALGTGITPAGQCMRVVRFLHMSSRLNLQNNFQVIQAVDEIKTQIGKRSEFVELCGDL